MLTAWTKNVTILFVFVDRYDEITHTEKWVAHILT